MRWSQMSWVVVCHDKMHATEGSNLLPNDVARRAIRFCALHYGARQKIDYCKTICQNCKTARHATFVKKW